MSIRVGAAHERVGESGMTDELGARGAREGWRRSGRGDGPGHLAQPRQPCPQGRVRDPKQPPELVAGAAGSHELRNPAQGGGEALRIGDPEGGGGLGGARGERLLSAAPSPGGPGRHRAQVAHDPHQPRTVAGSPTLLERDHQRRLHQVLGLLLGPAEPPGGGQQGAWIPGVGARGGHGELSGGRRTERG